MTCTLKSCMSSLCMLTIIFAVHVVSAAARDTLRASPLSSRSARHTSEAQEASQQVLRGPELADGMMHPVLPFLMADAEVTGEVKGADTAAGLATFTRALLHGKRRPSKYSRCPTCTMISLNKQTGTFSGHCKKRSKLFTCRRTGIVASSSGQCEGPDIPNLPADTLPPLRSVSVTAPAPFIGCANITGLPSGCPTEGTRGESDDGERFTVMGSICIDYRYSIKQCENGRPNDTPFYPFGYCLCVTRTRDGSLYWGPCQLSELRYKAPDAAKTDGVPVRVAPEGNTTVTTYGVREELDLRGYSNDKVFNSTGVTVDVEMIVWDALLNQGENLTLDGPLTLTHADDQ